MLIVEFADRAGLDAWLSGEPYIEDKVWQSWEIDELKLGPSFAGLFPTLGQK